MNLIAGDDLDLGTVSALNADPLLVEVSFEENGARVEPSRILRDLAQSTVNLSLSGLRFADPLSTFDSRLKLNPAEAAAIYGLPSGRWHAAVPAHELAPLFNPEYKITPGAQLGQSIEFPRERRLNIVVPVYRASVHYQVHVQLPLESLGSSFKWQIYSADGMRHATGQVRRVGLEPDESSTMNFEGGAGPYYLFIAIPQHSDPAPEIGWYGNAVLSGITESESVNVLLNAGLTVHGVYHPAPGLPVHGKLLNFSVIGIGAVNEVTRDQYFAVCAEDGGFTLVGVPNGAILQLEDSDTRWTITNPVQEIQIQ